MAHWNSSIFTQWWNYVNDGGGWASRGREFHKLGAITEKAFLGVLISQISPAGGTTSTASLAECTAREGWYQRRLFFKYPGPQIV